MAERWKPNNGEKYFYVNLHSAGSQGDTWTNHSFDKQQWKNGNCFKTKEEAEYAANKVKDLLLSLHYGVGTEILAKAGLVEWHKIFSSFLKKTLQKNNLQDSIQDSIQDKSLPKLTADVFNRPDCPKWAKYAGLGDGGTLFFYEDKPMMSKDEYLKRWINYERWYPVEGTKFDASDWQNTLVERPKNRVDWDEVEEILCNSKLTFKETKQGLLDWCKPGSWIYTSSEQYLKINDVSIDRQKFELSNGAIWSKQDIIDEAVSARLRPYNAEEIPDLPFEVSERNSNFRTTVVSCKGDKVWLAGATTAISTKELMQDFTTKVEPCGVLEHLEEGEWVE